MAKVNLERLELSQKSLERVVEIFDKFFPQLKCGSEASGRNFETVSLQIPFHSIYYAYRKGLFLKKTLAEIYADFDDGTYAVRISLNVPPSVYLQLEKELKVQVPEVYAALVKRAGLMQRTAGS